MQMQPPKGNSLSKKNTSYDVELVRIGPPVFFTAHPFTQPPNPTFYNAFQSARHPRSAPSRGCIYVPM